MGNCNLTNLLLDFSPKKIIGHVNNFVYKIMVFILKTKSYNQSSQSGSIKLQYSLTEYYVAIKKKKQDEINPIKAGQWKGSYQ